MISYRKEINDKTRTIKRYDQSTNTLRREKDELKKQILLLNENKIKGDGEKDKIIQENFEKTTTIQELQSVKKQLQEDVVKIQKELKDTLKILKQRVSFVFLHGLGSLHYSLCFLCLTNIFGVSNIFSILVIFLIILCF